MEQERLSRLIQAYGSGQISAAERDELLAWYRTHSYLDAEYPDSEDTTMLRMLGRLLRDTGYTEPRPVPRLGRWLPYAAAVAVLLTVGWLLLVVSQKSSGDSLAASEILPGGNRAVLTLADGRTIDLSSEHEGIAVADGITYLDGSQVMENEGPGEENGILNSQFSILNSITTPKGGTYQVTLPDGSKVWLNAGSTLKYPSRFSGDSREVFLEGEAYFDIRPQVGGVGAQYLPSVSPSGFAPFNVVTAGQLVQVLGTQFNISAYNDDPETKTTLVEGKVKVSHLTSHVSNLLAPGDQSIVRGASIEKHRVEVDQYTAWKEGLFNFDATTFEHAMLQLERWYDIEVAYEGSVPTDITLRGKMERNLSLQTVLHILERFNLRYRIEGRKLIIINEY